MSTERPLTILIVEDDPHACQDLTKAIDQTEGVVLAGTTAHADQAVMLIQDCLPDCLILDLELHAGSGNGLNLLRSMKQLALPRFPYVLITTNNSSIITHEAARTLGADFIFTKHQTDYSAKDVINFLFMIKGVIQSRPGSGSPENTVEETPSLRKKRLLRRIQTELNTIGISPKVTGYKYLTDAILLAIDRPEDHLIALIGEKYGQKNTTAERAMQYAIDKAWRVTDTDTLYRNYTAQIHSEKGMPTAMELIFYYANKLKNELQ